MEEDSPTKHLLPKRNSLVASRAIAPFDYAPFTSIRDSSAHTDSNITPQQHADFCLAATALRLSSFKQSVQTLKHIHNTVINMDKQLSEIQSELLGYSSALCLCVPRQAKPPVNPNIVPASNNQIIAIKCLIPFNTRTQCCKTVWFIWIVWLVMPVIRIMCANAKTSRLNEQFLKI